ncbi:MAG: thiamine phosphate synthase [Vicinamibacterales bacterium]
MRLTPLYAIADVEVCAAAGCDVADLARAWAEAGVSVVQLRAKTLDGAACLAAADRLQRLLAGTGTSLVVNDRVDVAAAIAAGVHLGQQDLPAGEARRLLGQGRSSAARHTPPANWRALSPGPSPRGVRSGVPDCHQARNPDPVVGLEGVAAAGAARTPPACPDQRWRHPRWPQLPSVIAAGADAVAVIGDLVGGPTPRRRARLARGLSRRACIPPARPVPAVRVAPPPVPRGGLNGFSLLKTKSIEQLVGDVEHGSKALRRSLTRRGI